MIVLDLRRFIRPLLAAGLLLAVCPKTPAQYFYATVHGTVSDSSGAVIPDADVTILNTSTGKTTTAKTDSQGYYVAPQLEIGGPYTITVNKGGFSPFQETGLNLISNDNREEDAKLKPGSAQTVRVESNAIQVETSDTQLKSTISANEIVSLPLLGRNVVALQKTTPGVVESSDRFGTFSTNGTQTSGNSFLLDGADINDAPLQSAAITPNPDALSEFQITASSLNPEFSRNSGAILLEQLKTGTNAFHGDAFEFYRDSSLETGNYFSQTRPPLHQNVYGGTFGGPIVKDKLFFFVAYQGIRNRTSATTQTPVFAPGLVSSGNFSNDINIGVGNNAPNSAGLSSNPIPFAIGACPAGTPWNACFTPGNPVIINPTQYNPIAAALTARYVPAPNNGNLYNFNAVNTLKNDQGIIRVDYRLSQHDTLWGSSIFQSAPTTEALPFTGATLPGFTEVDGSHVKVFNGSYTHVFNTSTLNEFRVNYLRFNFAAVEPQTVQQPSSAGFDITPQSSAGVGLPVINLTGLFTLGFSTNGPQPRNDQTYVYTDNFSKVIGNHNLRFGAIVHRFTVNNPFFNNLSGSYGFGGSGTYSSGDPAIDFLLGIPDTYNQGSGARIDARAYETYLYAQDNWKATNTFTFNYGTGYDIETPFANLQFGGVGINCFTAGVFGNNTAQSSVFPNGVPGLLYPGDPGCNTYGGPTVKYGHFAPRVGFAWSPSSGPGVLLGQSGAQDFAIRGGFGLYYNRDQEEGALQNLEDPPFGLNSAGFTGAPSFANPFRNVSTGQVAPNPFPYAFPKPGQPVDFSQTSGLFQNVIDPNNTVPVVYNFNVNVQRSIAGGYVFQVGYVGSLGHHLVRTFEGDPITLAGQAACVAAGAGCIGNASARTFQHAFFPDHAADPEVNPNTQTPYFYTAGTQATNGASSYNSLQVTAEKAPSHGLYFRVAYTYSHGLDDASGLESSGFNGRGTNTIPGFTHLNYGDSDFDARHRFSAVYTYQVPVGQYLNNHLLTREGLAGWTFSGITALQTGFPITISQTSGYNSGFCDALTFYSCPDTPQISTFKVPTKFQKPNNSGFSYFDPSLFSQEPLGTFGNVGRNFFHGPGFNYSNFTLAKNLFFDADHNRRVELRLEAYNAFNHPNFTVASGNFSNNSQFGQVQSVIQPGTNGDPQPGRVVQLGGKFYF